MLAPLVTPHVDDSLHQTIMSTVCSHLVPSVRARVTMHVREPGACRWRHVRDNMFFPFKKTTSCRGGNLGLCRDPANQLR